MRRRCTASAGADREAAGSTRITISVRDEVAEKAQRAVQAGEADSISGWFTELARREPDWIDARAALDEMIADAGGLPDGAREWARAVATGGPTAGAA